MPRQFNCQQILACEPCGFVVSSRVKHYPISLWIFDLWEDCAGSCFLQPVLTLEAMKFVILHMNDPEHLPTKERKRMEMDGDIEKSKNLTGAFWFKDAYK